MFGYKHVNMSQMSEVLNLKGDAFWFMLGLSINDWLTYCDKEEFFLLNISFGMKLIPKLAAWIR